ncbi:MAG: SDR family NAD(P)-dependent oxidoreductase [Acidimicrobiales bacterium]
MKDAFGHPQSLLVLGGTSDIARAIVRALIEGGTRRVVLGGRDPARLEEAATEATSAGADFVGTFGFDANDVAGAQGAVGSGFAKLGTTDMVLLATGLLCDKPEDEMDPERVATCIKVNFTWPAAALSAVAKNFSAQGTGTAVVISSVAGVRVRRSNYVYGSAKAGLDAYARSLDQALADSGSSVVVVRPGFVRSKMTEGRPDMPLATTPGAVARDVLRGLAASEKVVWSPRTLKAIFGVLNLLPEAIFRRLLA